MNLCSRYRPSCTDCRAARSNLRMVRPSLMSVVKLPIICAQSALQNFGPSYFSCQEDTSASLWELPLLCSLSLAILKPYACARTYVPFRILLQQFSLGTRPHKLTKVECIIMSQLRLKKVWPWPDQPDWFRRL